MLRCLRLRQAMLDRRRSESGALFQREHRKPPKSCTGLSGSAPGFALALPPRLFGI